MTRVTFHLLCVCVLTIIAQARSPEAMAQTSENTAMVLGTEGTALVAALRTAGVVLGSSYDTNGVWKGLRVDQVECHVPGFLTRYAVCWLTDQRGYPNRTVSLYGPGARNLFSALFEVPLVAERFADLEDLAITTISCNRWYPAVDYSCSIVVP